MQKILSHTGILFILIILCIISSYIVYSKIPFGQEIIEINKYNSLSLDFVFKYITHIGDGLFYGFVLILFLFFVKYRAAIIGLIIYAISSGVAQYLKHFVFADRARPLKYFGDKVKLHFVEGVNVHIMNSFPSGHTTSVFAMVIVIAYFAKANKWQQVLLCILACLVGFSRMYLCQHFLRDVIGGVCIGTLLAIVIIFIFERFKLLNSDSLNKKILK
jgi:membrane-associated phospholipid phosphatase